VRSRLGNNNNPNVIHLIATLKQILAVKLKPSLVGNCVPVQEKLGEELPAFGMSTGLPSNKNDEQQGQEDDCLPMNLNLFIDNIVTYIAGFCVRKVLLKVKCVACSTALVSTNDNVGG
jgi:hypothetical protein